MMQSGAIVRRSAGLPPVMDRDLRAINRVLAAAGLKARAGLYDRAGRLLTRVIGSASAGQLVIYGLDRPDPGEKLSKIGGLLDELAEELTQSRGRETLPRLSMRPAALELEHWRPAPLPWSAPLGLDPDVARIGRTFAGGTARDLLLDLGRLPHWLFVAKSGAGKSVAMAGSLISLCLNTAPDRLRLHLIDPKNEDMADLAGLPHVEELAITPAEIGRVVRWFDSELDRRIAAGRGDWCRHVLVFDELTSAVDVAPELGAFLGRLGNMGRSKRLNVIAGAQYATKGTIGDVAGSFSARIVGSVTSAGESVIAGGLPELGAERLPLGQGAFLAVVDGQVSRLGSYYLQDVAGAVASVRAKWGQVSPPASISAPGPAVLPTVDDPAPVSVDYVDRALRLGWEELHGRIAGAIAEEHEGGAGHNELIRVAYRAGLLNRDYPGGANSDKVRAAISVLEGVICAG